MNKSKFVDELQKLSDETGADVYLNLVNPKGSPLERCKMDTLDPRLLEQCHIASAVIIPRIVEEAESNDDGEASISDHSSEI
jgi:hypothetical protein